MELVRDNSLEAAHTDRRAIAQREAAPCLQTKQAVLVVASHTPVRRMNTLPLFEELVVYNTIAVSAWEAADSRYVGAFAAAHCFGNARK